MKQSKTPLNAQPLSIAIIGMACRFPGAQNYHEFWQNLVNSTENTTDIPIERWDWHDYTDQLKNNPYANASKWGCFIDGVDQFDANFFGISPHEASTMDPQQRLLLESVWACIEDAGYAPLSLTNKDTGVYIGACNYEYKDLQDKYGKENSDRFMFGKGHSILANRISYFFDLHGPSMLIDTACSSSLVAIHQAVRAIQYGECSNALVGGVNILCDPEQYVMLNKAGVLSPSGQCHSFDMDADGYVRGEGVGVIYLKPLEQALQDNNTIYGVIKGTAVNHCGRTRSISSPSPYLQSQVIVKAWRQANINPSEISYIEAHGTGTPLGDPIELIGLKKAFKQLSKDYETPLSEHYCALGTVKTNIGHLEAASGISGVIKVLLSMQHKKLPMLQNFKTINPHLSLEKTPFYLSTSTVQWSNCSDIAGPLFAGVSSFGIGGTNAHVVIEDGASFTLNHLKNMPSLSAHTTEKTYHILTLSAKHPESLKQRIVDLKNWLSENTTATIASLAYTLNLTRDHFHYRVAFIVDSIKELDHQLTNYEFIKIDSIPDDCKKIEHILSSHYMQLQNPSLSLAEQKATLDELAYLYVQKGSYLDWEKIYPEKNKQYIKLPTYPFFKKSYWFNTDVEQTSESFTQNINNNVFCLKIIDNDIAVLQMHDTIHKNQMSESFLNELQENLNYISKNPTLKVLVITGYDDVFCFGSDENSLRSITQQKVNFTSLPIIYQGLLNCKIPVISAMQGHAFGAGLTFGLYADIVILSEDHIYSSNFMNYGLTPGVGSTLIMTEKLSFPLATEMMWTAREYSGRELKERGAKLIFKPAKDVLNEAINIAKIISKNSLLTLKTYKTFTGNYFLKNLSKTIEEELGMHQAILQSSDASEKVEIHFSKLNEWNTNGRKQCPAQEDKALSEKEIFHAQSDNEARSLMPLRLRKDNLSWKPISSSADNFSPISHSEIKIKLKDISETSTTHQNNNNNITSCLFLVRELLSTQLHISIDEINPKSLFQDLGVDSIVILMLTEKINKTLGFNLSSSTLYDYQSVENLANFLALELSSVDNPPSEAYRPGPATCQQALDKQSLQTTSDSIELTSNPNENVKPDELHPTTSKQESWSNLSMQGVALHKFNIVERINWKDKLNLTSLHKSLLFLVSKQAVLRTQFVISNSKLFQKTLNCPDHIHIELENSCHISLNQQEAHVKERCEYYNNHVFKFTDYPLWKLIIIQFSDHDYDILIVSSHIIVDAYAITLMAKQLFYGYLSIEMGQEPVIPDLQMTFVQYVIKLQEGYQLAIHANELTYWENKLKNPSAHRQLYLDNKLIADHNIGFKLALKQFIIPQEQFKQIQMMVNKQSCTDTAFLLALFRVVLLHYTHEENIWIDVVDALRNPTNTSLIGWTATSYPHITCLKYGDLFLDVIAKVQAEFIEVKENSRLPLSNIIYPSHMRFRDQVTSIQFNRIPDVSRLFDDIPAINHVDFPVIPNFYVCNLACLVSEADSQFNYSFLYNSEQFSSDLIEGMLLECKRVLNDVLSENTISVNELMERMKERNDCVLC